jgi:hypothetical protein
MSSRGIIAQQADEVCEMCGKVDECRPYGANDENICFDCAMLDKATTERKMAAYLFGNDE